MKNHKLWKQLGTSLYVLSDTQNAIESFIKIDETDNNGFNYLVNFGILQVLFLQQDAIRSIIESLGLEFELTDKLIEIREIRSDIAGHPTNRKNKKSTHFIVQTSLKTKHFSVADHYGNELPEFRFVDTATLVEEQQGEITILLGKIVEELERERQKHKEEFKMTKLSDILHFNKFYKDLEEISRPLGDEPSYNFQYGKSSLETLANRLKSFKAELSKRDLLGNIDSIDHILSMLDHPINEIRDFYKENEDSRLNKKDIKIFLEYIRFSLQEFYDIASEIDDDYSTKDS